MPCPSSRSFPVCTIAMSSRYDCYHAPVEAFPISCELLSYAKQAHEAISGYFSIRSQTLWVQTFQLCNTPGIGAHSNFVARARDVKFAQTPYNIERNRLVRPKNTPVVEIKRGLILFRHLFSKLIIKILIKVQMREIHFHNSRYL